MDTKKISVVLEAVTSGFKNKMNEVKSIGQETTVKMAQLKQEISQLKSEMRGTDIGSRAFKEYAIAVSDAEQELKRLESQQKKTTEPTIGKSIDGLRNKVVRFGLALFSIRSIFSLASRASSSYLSADTDLAGKMQSAWAGLGSFLAPIIERITNMILKLVKYMNIFIKAVTGQDLLAKAANKATASLKKQNQATKAINKSLSTMDEITNISKDETSGAGAGMDTTPFDAFKDVEVDTKWADRITKFGKWIKNNWQIIALGIGGIGLAIEGLKLAMKSGEFTTFSKVLIGIGLICLGVATFISGLKGYLDDMKKGVEDTAKGWKNMGKMLSGIGLVIAGIGVIFGSIPIIITGAVVTILGILTAFWPKIKEGITNFKNWLLKGAEFLFGKTLGDIITAPFFDMIDIVMNLFDGLLTGVKKVVTGIIQVFKGDLKGGITNIVKGIGNICIGIINSLISGLNSTIAPIRALVVAVGKVMGKSWTMNDIKIPKIPMLATGTNYVPEDQLAYIHKGEAVVPKKFNSAEYFSNYSNNEETNALLMDVNRNLLTLIDKDTNLYVNGKELARTTYNDFQNEGNRLGKSSIVSVR